MPERRDCPCCAGHHIGDPFDLCDTCLAASVAGRFPHDCNRPTTEESAR